MKIVNSISKIYFEQRPLAEKLQQQVDNTVRANKKDTWHYYSRIKSEESFALKLETGRVKTPSKLEDFYACTLVVENINEIKKGVEFIESLFDIKNRKPAEDSFTHKESYSFAFDDLRLYVSLKKVEYLPPGSLPDLIFEIQIKTFLQHAWSIATHDLIYKSDTVSWPKQRIAYQVKAMLEQAEISISGVDGLSQLPELAKENRESKGLNQIKNFLIDTFPAEALPFDLLRLSGIVNDVLRTFKVDLVQLKVIVDAETAAEKGVKTLDLSPYGIILQSIINQKPVLFESVFKNGYKLRSNGIFLPSEILVDKINFEEETNAIRI